MFRKWDVRDVGCWRCGILGMWDVGDVGCSRCGMFGMWDVRDVRCLPVCGMLIYQMPFFYTTIFFFFFFFFLIKINLNFILKNASNVLLYDYLYHLQGVHYLCFDESHLSDLPQQVVWSARVKKFLNIQDNLNKIKPSPLSWWR